MEDPAEDILRFITNRIDTVPELEALLLFWEQAPAGLTAKQLASRLYVPRGVAARIVRVLKRRKFIVPRASGSEYVYDSAWEPSDQFMYRVAVTYRRHLIRIARLLHSKAPTSVLEFARAFERWKDS